MPMKVRKQRHVSVAQLLIERLVVQAHPGTVYFAASFLAVNAEI